MTRHIHGLRTHTWNSMTVSVREGPGCRTYTYRAAMSAGRSKVSGMETASVKGLKSFLLSPYPDGSKGVVDVSGEAVYTGASTDAVYKCIVTCILLLVCDMRAELILILYYLFKNN